MAAFFGADEIWNTGQSGDEKEPVILAGVRRTAEREAVSQEAFDHSMDELAELAQACYMEPVCFVTQQLPRVDQALYVRQGKAAEIADLVDKLEARRVIFNDTLSPSQLRNLQKILRVPIMDRTRLILEIFERRARTREAKLQVELAKLQYLKPRLIGLWETQNRQGGASGSMSTRGEGEKQLEIDRRTIDHRLSELRRELRLVSRERETQRKRRSRSHVPLVSLVGYTNAGKSTIMNAMIERWGRSTPGVPADRAGGVFSGGSMPGQSVSVSAGNSIPEQPGSVSAESGIPDGKNDHKKVFEADMLFATLDTSIRKISVSRGREFLLSDTVGFINELPTALVEAFHSTLEEVTQADLLLQVVDGSDPHYPDHMVVTRQTITDLGAGHIPMITVFNKSDMRDPAIDYPRRGLRESSVSGETNENVYISAKESTSIELLTEAILEKLECSDVTRQFLIPYRMGNVLSYLTENARILTLDYREDGTFMEVSCDPVTAVRAQRMLENGSV